jgi:hypothetical protein
VSGSHRAILSGTGSQGWPSLPSGMLAEASLLVALSVEHGSGTDACMNERQLKRAVEKRLKRRVFVERDAASLRLDVSFSQNDGSVEARISIASIDGTPRGTRSLVTEGHCSALDDSVALSVALLVDQPPEPEPVLEPLPPPPTSSSAPPAVAPKRPTRITLPPETVAPREPWHGHLGTSGLLGWGAVPKLVPGLAVYLKLVPARLVPIILQGEGFVRAEAERDASSGARFRLLRVSLAVCPWGDESAARGVWLCLGQKVGWLEVAGYGFDHDFEQRRLTYALSAGGEGRLRLFAPVSLRAFVGAEVPFVRDTFTSGGERPARLFRPSPAAISAEIGLDIAVW